MLTDWIADYEVRFAYSIFLDADGNGVNPVEWTNYNFEYQITSPELGISKYGTGSTNSANDAFGGVLVDAAVFPPDGFDSYSTVDASIRVDMQSGNSCSATSSVVVP